MSIELTPKYFEEVTKEAEKDFKKIRGVHYSEKDPSFFSNIFLYHDLSIVFNIATNYLNEFSLEFIQDISSVREAEQAYKWTPTESLFLNSGFDTKFATTRQLITNKWIELASTKDEIKNAMCNPFSFKKGYEKLLMIAKNSMELNDIFSSMPFTKYSEEEKDYWMKIFMEKLHEFYQGELRVIIPQVLAMYYFTEKEKEVMNCLFNQRVADKPYNPDAFK